MAFCYLVHYVFSYTDEFELDAIVVSIIVKKI